MINKELNQLIEAFKVKENKRVSWKKTCEKLGEYLLDSKNKLQNNLNQQLVSLSKSLKREYSTKQSLKQREEINKIKDPLYFNVILRELDKINWNLSLVPDFLQFIKGNLKNWDEFRKDYDYSTIGRYLLDIMDDLSLRQSEHLIAYKKFEKLIKRITNWDDELKKMYPLFLKGLKFEEIEKKTGIEVSRQIFLISKNKAEKIFQR